MKLITSPSDSRVSRACLENHTKRVCERKWVNVLCGRAGGRRGEAARGGAWLIVSLPSTLLYQNMSGGPSGSQVVLGAKHPGGRGGRVSASIPPWPSRPKAPLKLSGNFEAYLMEVAVGVWTVVLQ